MHAVWWQCDLLETNGDWKRARQHSACWTSMRTPVQSQYICKTRVWWYTCIPTIGGEETRGSMNWLASLPESPHLNKESGDSLKKTPVVNLWPQQALPTHPPTHPHQYTLWEVVCRRQCCRYTCWNEMQFPNHVYNGLSHHKSRQS